MNKKGEVIIWRSSIGYGYLSVSHWLQKQFGWRIQRRGANAVTQFRGFQKQHQTNGGETTLTAVASDNIRT